MLRRPPWRLLLPAAATALLALAACAGANDRPTADAGADLTVSAAETISLDGSASKALGSGTLTFTWRFDSLPAGSALENGSISPNQSASAKKATFTPDRSGTYGVTLQVSEDGLDSDLDYLLVHVGTGNHAPVADAGDDQEGATGEAVFLHGSATDEDEGAILAYRWAFELVPAGSSLTDHSINNQGTANAAILPDVIGMYVLTLTVSDGEFDSVPDYVTVVAGEGNDPPVADAGTSQLLTPCSGYQVSLDGRASYDPEGGDLAYRWEVIDAPSGAPPALDDPASATPLFTWSEVGVYTVQLVVNDGLADSRADFVALSTQAPSPNQAPVSVAGEDVVIDSTAYCIGASCTPCGDRTLTLDGSDSYDPEHDPLSWQWSVTSGVGAELKADINDVASILIPELSTSVGTTATATYQVTLTVADCQANDADTLTITFFCTGG